MEGPSPALSSSSAPLFPTVIEVPGDPVAHPFFKKKIAPIHTCHLLFYFLQKNHLLAYSNSKEVLTLWLAITGVEARFTGKMNK